MRINVWHVYPHLDVFFYDTCIQVNMPCGSCTNMFADVIARFRWTGQTPLNRPVREQYPLNDLNSIEALGVFFGEVPEKTANTVALKSTDLCIFHVHILSIYVFIYIYHYSLYFHTTHVHLDLEYHNIYILQMLAHEFHIVGIWPKWFKSLT